MQTIDTTARLKALRDLMRTANIDVYVVPSEDGHQSEYIAPCDARREFISGFSGSAGTAVIALDKAALATDGRYFNQASKQLDSNWELLKQGLEDVPTWQEWTADRAAATATDAGGQEKEAVVGVDPTVITASEARKLSEKIKKKGGKELVGLPTNLVDQVWGDSRPKRPEEKIKPLKLEFSGKPLSEKIADLRKVLEKKKSAGLIISMLDEVAWLYNLRGNDIPYNPVFFSYAIVTPETASLYVDATKFEPEVLSHLDGQVKVCPYDAMLDDLTLLSQSAPKAPNAEPSGKLPQRKYMISTKASWALSLQLGGESAVDELRSPVGDAKAIKNKTEVAGMKKCHIRDGAALTEYFAWLEDFLCSGGKIDEVEAADKLTSIRAKKLNFAGLSFDIISSVGPNAAIIHYSPKRGSAATLNRNSIYLCDSGGQYFDGTTDTTRTLHFGDPSALERKAYTLVLKGVIALATAVFPGGNTTTGFALDAFARQHLWAHGLDYRHGTGHGVGSYLNVHEGPVGIGARPAYAEVGLAAGNVLSDEPGYYEDGKFGVRIENVIVCVEKETEGKFGDKPWLGFETATTVPYCRNLIDATLLTDPERDWINKYHARVRDVLGAELKEQSTQTQKNGEEEEKALKLTMGWLERETKEI